MSRASREGATAGGRARPGVFLVIEGPEGAGKSTQIARLAERLRAAGRDPLLTREPGGTRAGDAIRQVVLDPSQHISPLAEFLLYSASRAQLVEEVIAPALAGGRDVVSDRYASASVAYQGHGRGLDLQLIEDLNRRVTGGVRPDLTLLLDIDPSAGLSRAAQRSSHDRLEAAGLEFHRRVRDGYLSQARSQPGWLVIDAAAPEAAVADELWRAVAPLVTSGVVAPGGGQDG